MIMIRSFGNRQTERFFAREQVATFQGFAVQATRRLTVLDNAESLRDLAGLRSDRLESLPGSRADQHSIRIDSQWCICFRWEDGVSRDVEIVDYH